MLLLMLLSVVSHALLGSDYPPWAGGSPHALRAMAARGQARVGVAGQAPAAAQSAGAAQWHRLRQPEPQLPWGAVPPTGHAVARAHWQPPTRAPPKHHPTHPRALPALPPPQANTEMVVGTMRAYPEASATELMHYVDHFFPKNAATPGDKKDQR